MMWPGNAVGQPAVLQQYGTVDDHIIDFDRVPLQLRAAGGQVGDRIALDHECQQRWLRSNFVALPLAETEHDAQWAGNPGNAGS
jgi:hypothetical protein